MNEILERVSKAIDAASQPPGQKDYKVLMENCARAALEALREPTAEMVESGCMAGTNLTTGQPSARLGARTAGERMTDQWRAMIDAALTQS